MIENQEQPKIDYEIATCNTFLTIYDKNISFIKHGDPQLNEPDCICTNDLAMEIVGIYDDEAQAKDLWQKEETKKSSNDDFDLDSFENLYIKISDKLSKLNDGLYEGFKGKIILVCDMLSPVVKNEDIKKYIELYVPFKNEYKYIEYFDEIWMLWKIEETNEYKITRLE